MARWGWERDEITCQSCGGTASSTAGSLVQQRRNSLVLGHDWVMSNRALNQFRFQYAPFAYLNNPSEATNIWTEVGNFDPVRFSQMTPGVRLSELDLRHHSQQGPDRDVVGIPRRLLDHHQQGRQPQLEDGRGVGAGTEYRRPDRQSARHLDLQHRPAVQSEQSGDGRGVAGADAVHRIDAPGRARSGDQPVPGLLAGCVAAHQRADRESRRALRPGIWIVQSEHGPVLVSQAAAVHQSLHARRPQQRPAPRRPGVGFGQERGVGGPGVVRRL